MLKFLILFFVFLISSTFASNTCPYPCNGKPGTAYWARNPRGCAWFFTCNVDQPPKENRCPEGFRFNYEQQLCDFAENVPCGSDDEEPVISCPPKGIAKIPHPDTCSKYILCFDGIEQDRYCPLGTHFSRFENSCVRPDLSDCATDREFCGRNRDEDDEIFPKVANPRDCGTFYVCSNDDWVISNQCFDGWHFNPTTGQCEDAATAGCDADKQQTRLEFIPETVDTDCNGQLDGSAHPHPESCDFWFLCARGRSFLQMCGTGSKFDVNQKRCVSEAEESLVCSTDTQSLSAVDDKMTQARQLLEKFGSRIRSRI